VGGRANKRCILEGGTGPEVVEEYVENGGGREGELSFNYSLIISNRFRVKNVSARMALKFLIF